MSSVASLSLDASSSSLSITMSLSPGALSLSIGVSLSSGASGCSVGGTSAVPLVVTSTLSVNKRDK